MMFHPLVWIRKHVFGADGAMEGHPAYDLGKEAFAEIQGGNPTRARQLLLQALDYRNEINDPAFVHWALTCVHATWPEQDHSAAIEFFSDYITSYPEEPAAYAARAPNLWYIGQLDSALADYSRALELDPNDIASLLGRGQVLVELGQHEKALQDLNIALMRVNGGGLMDAPWANEFRAFTHNGRGAAFAGLGEFKRAFEEFAMSVSLAPDNAWVYFNRAHACEIRNLREQAISDYRLSLQKANPKLTEYKKPLPQNFFPRVRWCPWRAGMARVPH